tara:strand:- start:1101 stop:1823 length:723 start_codon:yes stop_codon:yes gene_type:complete
MTKILGISGRKQSGKNTVANIVTGEIIKNKKMVYNSDIDDQGRLMIETSNESGDKGWGIFDITRKDEAFTAYAEQELWPFTKVYHFADCLKQLCVSLFDLTPEQVYGTDDQKNTSTPYSQNGWKHPMTAREFLQYFGTDVMREIKDKVWVDYTIKQILQEQSELSIIPDVRFPNEVNAIQAAGGVVIRLDRDIFSDNHPCECALDRNVFDWDEFDHVINNDGKSLNDLRNEIKNIQSLWR